MKREIYIFVFLLIFLSLVMHFKEFTSFPIEHIKNLPNSGAYGFGFLHPFIFTFVFYVILWIPRGIYRLIKR